VVVATCPLSKTRHSKLFALLAQRLTLPRHTSPEAVNAREITGKSNALVLLRDAASSVKNIDQLRNVCVPAAVHNCSHRITVHAQCALQYAR
jgi:hypothetical protein